MLKAWISNLDKIDAETEKTTLAQLLEKFASTRQGKSESTKSTEQGIINRLEEQWPHGLDIRVSRIKPSMLDEWLAKQEPKLKNTSYNRYTLFLKQLFDFAVNDRILAESPFYRLQKGWKKPEKPRRLVPTEEQFHAIVNSIKSQTQYAEAEESANFIEFMGVAGLGQAEASSLKWADVDWQKNELVVRRHKTRALFHPPIYPDLKPFLERLYARHSTPPESQTAIFQIRDARKALTNACTRLGFPHFTQRSIRAFLIRRLWKAKVDLKLIAMWQGHSDGGKLIISTYTEVFGDNDADYIKSELAKLSPKPAPPAASEPAASSKAPEPDTQISGQEIPNTQH
jgi:integrase